MTLTMKQRTLPLLPADPLALFVLLLHRYSGESQLSFLLNGEPTTVTVDGTAPFAALVEAAGKRTAVLSLTDPQHLPVLAQNLSQRLPATAAQPILTFDPQSGVLTHAAEIFDEATIDRLAGHWQTLGQAVGDLPETAVAHLPLLTRQEQNQLLNEWNDTKQYEYPGLHQMFEQVVAESPNSLAITFEDREINYGELNGRANQIAHALIKMGVRPQDRIAIMLENGPQQVEALFGVLKAGGVFVCLDPHYPTHRLQAILDEAQPARFILEASCLERHEDLLTNLPTGCNILAIDGLKTFTAENAESAEKNKKISASSAPSVVKKIEATIYGPGFIEACADTTPNLSLKPTDPAYIVYTSGSTGKPKGILQSHLSFCQFIDWQGRYFGIVAPQRFAQWASIAYDASYCEIFGTLCFGATLCMAPAMIRFNPQALIEWVRQAEITILQIVPSFCRQVLQLLEAEPSQNGSHPLPKLEMLLLAGEILPVDLAHAWLNRFPNPAKLFNLYGPSESVLATYHAIPKVEPDQRAISVGRAIDGRQLLILDKNQQLCPIGVRGELYIRSPYLTEGYIERPDEMAAKYVQNPLHDDFSDRVYRTGDMGRWLADGTIEFYGRLDNLVKLRGMRVELGDIEAALRGHEAVRNCAVVVRKVTRDKSRLIVKDRETRSKSTASEQQILMAYYTAERPLSGYELRAYLEELLPPHMIPQQFVQLDELPYNANHKLDLRALPEPQNLRPDLRQPYIAPRNALEERIADIWQDVLGINQVGMEDGFFELGGDSLLAMQVLNRTREATQAKLSFRHLFERQTVAKLAELVAEPAEPTSTPSQMPVHAEARTHYPLSVAQQGIWFLWKLEPDSPYYTAQGVIHLRGAVDVTILQRAWQALIDRHVILRAKFGMDENGRPTQTFPQRQDELQLIDLTHFSADEREAYLKEFMYEKGQQPLHLEKHNLLQANLFKLAEDSYDMPITFHEITLDLWGWSNMIQDLGALYDGFRRGEDNPLPPLPFSFADYVLWENEAITKSSLQAQETYWQEQLAGELPVLSLPTDRPHPAHPTFRGEAQAVMLDAELTAQLKALSQQQGATLFMTMLTAFNIMLRLYAGQDDLIVGAPLANRTRDHAEDLVGFFLNMLPLRTKFGDDPSFADVLTQVRDTVTGAISNAEYPFSWMLEWAQTARDVSISPVFQVMFNMLNLPQSSVALNDLSLSFSELDTGYIKYDLALYAHEHGDEIFLQLAYLTDLFDATTIERMLANLVVILRQAVVNLERPLSQLTLITESERQTVLHDWNQTAQDFGSELTITELFERQAAKTPTATALICQNETMRYADLNQQANQLAHYLRQSGVGQGSFVAICTERSFQMMVGLLGILKAGGAYVALDPDYPMARLQDILSDTQPKLLIVQESVDRFTNFAGKKVCLDRDWATIDQQLATNPTSTTTPNDLINLVYTSSTTGKPKGARIPMSAVLNRLLWMWDEYPFVVGDTAVLQKSYALVAATWELFGGLLKGIPTLILQPEAVRDADLLWQQLTRHKVSHLLSSPALIENVLQAAAREESRWDSLRFATTSAEPISPAMVRRWQETFPGVPLLNLYGSTECSSNATQYDAATLPETAVRVPIGQPLPNIQVYVLDQNHQPVPIGAVGELCIAGACLADGYLNLPELSAEKFVQLSITDNRLPNTVYRTGDLARWRSDGQLELVGRRDYQVKIRGFRVELNDIEAVLMQQGDVKKCAVALADADSDHKRLVAYVVPKTDGVQLNDLRDFLRQRLPGYMVPSDFFLLDAMPLGPTGKINRKALPKPEELQTGLMDTAVLPTTPLQITLANIWQPLLGREQIGIHANFFDVGGHSLLATQVVSRIRDQLNVELSQRRFFEIPTIAELAIEIEQMQAETAASHDDEMADLMVELENLSDEEAEALLAQMMAEE
ncbi:amino acid adenylation domain-containing protein [Candidatus Leptofilum sp.]|uniref:amino acid adenylation domain-containing protein n=1 Tax=Candidatus Leptofilum sp. TaxID=3241576 RepID=UPI003B59219C